MKEPDYLEYKPLIEVKEYHRDVLVDYMYNHYDCENITDEYKDSFFYGVLIDGLSNYYNAAAKQDPVLLKVIKDDRSDQMYKIEEEGYDELNFFYVFIDRESGYFLTNSNIIAYELTLEKGVSQEAYDDENVELLDALNYIDGFMRLNKTEV